LWKYLPHVPPTNKKQVGLKRKSEVTDKEVLNLTGGLFPIKLVDPSKSVQQTSLRILHKLRNLTIGWEFLSFKETIKLVQFIIGLLKD